MRVEESRLDGGLAVSAPLLGCLVDMLHKFCKIYLSVIIDIDLLNEILQFLRMNVPNPTMKYSHDFLSIYQTIAIIIEQFKGLLELLLTEAVIDA